MQTHPGGQQSLSLPKHGKLIGHLDLCVASIPFKMRAGEVLGIANTEATRKGRRLIARMIIRFLLAARFLCLVRMDWGNGLAGPHILYLIALAGVACAGRT